MKKKYHHRLGTGGYATAMPKWDKKEEEMLAKGIIPEPIHEEWELRAINFSLCMGMSMTMRQGTLFAVTGDMAESGERN